MNTSKLLHAGNRFWCFPKSFCCVSFHRSSHNLSNNQAFPIGGYYLAILESSSQNNTSSANKAVSPDSQLSTNNNFPSTSSELPKSQLLSICNIKPEIPPKPKEPDNCCMSGCVNCVWEIYAEELEAWASARKKVESASKDVMSSGLTRDTQSFGNSYHEKDMPSVTSEDPTFRDKVKKDKSITGNKFHSTRERDPTKDTYDLTDMKDQYSDLPLGIREFMKLENRLKKKSSTQ